MSTEQAQGAYGGYIPVPGHPLVRVEVHSVSDGIAKMRYVGDREPLLASGVADEHMLAPRVRKTGKGSRPTRLEYTYVDRYWRNSGAEPVPRFRLFMVRTLENARRLPGFSEALAALDARSADRLAALQIAPAPRSPPRARGRHLRLVVDNTRGLEP